MRKVIRIIFVFLLFFLFTTTYAQKILLEYFDGREIVVYTPDYKLLLLAELETGNEIPVGSIIETGRKSTCEFRLVPDGTIIKVADRTTFKIEELQGIDQREKNQFKLISGAMRAVTGKKPSGDEYVFICGSSTVYPDKADFGITVKKGWEEIPFVLEGKVRYVNARGKEIVILPDQMAGGLDENFEAGPMSIRIKRLANSLAFSFLNPGDTGSFPEETYGPTESPAETPVSGLTPMSTESTGFTPTPLPVVTARPTPESVYESEEFLPESTEEENSKEKEETMLTLDPSREELYPAADYAFISNYTDSFHFQIQEVSDEFVTVSFTSPETEEKKEAVELPEYTLFEIYNIFEKKNELSGKVVYSEFVDSVYLAKVENNVFYFTFLWEGAKKNIKPGFYLYPTGKLYSPAEDKIITVKEKEDGEDSEDGKVVVMEEELDFSGGSGGKTGKEKTEPLIGFNLDVGFSITMSFFNMGTGYDFLDYFLNLFLMLGSLRGRTFADASIKFTSWFGIGAEVGAATMYSTLTVDDIEIDLYFIDFPLRGFLRFGTRDFYIQPYCGYYFSFLLPEGGEFLPTGYSGLDIGATASLGGFYLEGSYILGELTGGLNYPRIGIGVVLNDILGTGK
ncbi:MAG: hypothetical protein JXB88_02340 [Spirochaetales bacterium]|nr:hypothetical protein [Spirochaetales bacterium]